MQNSFRVSHGANTRFSREKLTKNLLVSQVISFWYTIFVSLFTGKHKKFTIIVLNIYCAFNVVWQSCLLTIYRHNKMWSHRGSQPNVDLDPSSCSYCHCSLAHQGTSLCSPLLSHRSTPRFPNTSKSTFKRVHCLKNGPHFTFYTAEATNAILYGA